MARADSFQQCHNITANRYKAKIPFLSDFQKKPTLSFKNPSSFQRNIKTCIWGLDKQTYEIFQKEQRMCLRFASFGFQIEHLFEVTGISSPDISILRHGPIFRVNGRSADLKSLSSGNNLVKQAKNAIRKKKADLVLFEFTCHNKRIARELNKLPRLGIHGYYYYTDEDTYYVF